MLARLVCALLRCELVREYNGSHLCCRCLRCGRTTPGWVYGEPAASVVGSQAYWDAIYQDCIDVELSLHGGG